MNIVIVGGGLVGSTLSEKLSHDGHDVCLLDKDYDLVRKISDALDIRALQGNGATAPDLRRAGVEEANLVVASTNSDEANMIVGMLSAFVFDVPRIVVRLRDAGHAEGFAFIAQDQPAERVWVNPDQAAVDRIAALLEVPGAVDVVSFMEGNLLVAGFRIRASSDFAGMRVSDMNLLFAATPTLAVAIQRRDDWIIPHGGEEIAEGDLVYFAISRDQLDDVLSLVGVPTDKRNNVMIAGASPIGLELARRLGQANVPVVLVEENEELAHSASEDLRKRASTSSRPSSRSGTTTS
jgi:trk system potassium uptake protein TrkA